MISSKHIAVGDGQDKLSAASMWKDGHGKPVAFVPWRK
jgi:hypothetical protein